MRKIFELQVFKIFMLWVHRALWFSSRSLTVIVVSMVFCALALLFFLRVVDVRTGLVISDPLSREPGPSLHILFLQVIYTNIYYCFAVR